MKKFLATILILLFNNTSYADVNVNNCDNLENKFVMRKILKKTIKIMYFIFFALSF